MLTWQDVLFREYAILDTGIFTNYAVVSAVVSFFLTWYYLGVGITLGYHRILTHRSLQVPKWLEYLIVSGGYMCLMGSPVVWVAVHRLHHLRSDQPGDPHSPRDGFTHALYQWMFEMSKYQSDDEVKRVCSDLMKDPLYRALGSDHQPGQAMMCLTVVVLSRVLLLLVFGWPAMLANVAATVMVFWSTQFVNTFCHMEGHGYRTFKTREDSRNVWWVAILAAGEGWHNNHHAMPKSAQHGMAKHEFDITWVTVCVLEALGLAKNVVRPNPQVAMSKRLVPVPHNISLYHTTKEAKARYAAGDIEEAYNASQLVTDKDEEQMAQAAAAASAPEKPTVTSTSDKAEEYAGASRK